jgi:hypothetical protein
VKPRFPPHPLNVPGPFYVENDLCITCGVPEAEAPTLIAMYVDPSGTNQNSHCYFKKQPETPDELELAISAVNLGCCGAYRYGGDDPEVIRRLLEAGVHAGQIDQLVTPELIAEQQRKLEEFKLSMEAIRLERNRRPWWKLW